MNQKIGLFIGRFQPFHLGHLEDIQQIAETPDIAKVIVGIGSSQEEYTQQNPFTVTEREAMILASVDLEKPFELLEIPDIHNDQKWVKWVESLCPEIGAENTVIYSGNSW